ncbi:hypothetical protein ACFU7Y_12685 [Kitasatospora sp. NPDC057542]|uniref:hypothetical protein n=1 Tax=Kitasatospora sp. NPDC057542 TaxID=3346162 RepID=UPI0036C698F1
MTAARRKRIAWGLRGVALAALSAYLVGRHASRSGGLVELELWFHRPVLLVGSAVVLVLISLLVELEFRTPESQIGLVGGLVALVFLGVPVALSTLVAEDSGVRTAREAAPGHPDRVLVFTNVADSIDPVYRVELLTGSGWSARHWSLGTWGQGERLVRAEWSGPGRITVTSEKEIRVFTVGEDGTLGDPSVTPRRR